MSWRRLALWGVLGLGLVLVGLMAVRVARGRAEPPPVLGHLPAFALVDQGGQPVTLESLRGAPWVASFVFTRCGGFCPRINERMVALGPRLPRTVRRISISVDPEHDTPAVLAPYARRYGATAPDWRFLTGDPADPGAAAKVSALVGKGFMLAVGAGSDPAEPILHSARLVLVDGDGAIRGAFDSEDPASIEQLVRAARTLS